MVTWSMSLATALTRSLILIKVQLLQGGLGVTGYVKALNSSVCFDILTKYLGCSCSHDRR